jgi:hypothetical protein
MKIFSIKIFTLVLFLCFTLPSFGQTATTIVAGNWNVAANWSTGVVPNSTTPVVVSLAMNINQNISVAAKYIFNANASGNQVLNMTADSLIINANVGFNTSGNNLSNGVILVKSGSTFTIGDINTSGGLKIVIEPGATMVVNGSINNNGATFQVDGTLTVTGNYSASNSSGNVTGGGSFTTGGSMGAMNGGTVFGNTNPSCSSNCNGGNLCGATVTITPGASSICTGKNISISSSSTGSPTAYQWQSSSTNSGFSDVGGQTTSSFSGSPSSDTYYRLKVTVAGCITSSACSLITVNANPSSPTAPDVSRCGTGVVGLSASGSTGTYNWYSDAAGTILVQSGSSYTTPSLTVSTPYYVNAVNGATSCESSLVTVNAIVQSCTGILSSSLDNRTSVYSSNKKLFIHTNAASFISVYNMQGQMIAAQEILSDQDNDSEMDLGNISLGIYHVCIKTPNGTSSTNVFVE